uniref:Uncharacterized protein n=1 Tax=Hyaloperonospora arabidopsidis (strain Emoy2) TaxID=559515 RepID=M4BNQ1_HYAAE
MLESPPPRWRRCKNRTPASVKRMNDYARSPVRMELDLAPGESRGYWKYRNIGKWFKQAKATGKNNNGKATMLFDSGAEVSVDTTFARKVDQEAILDLADGTLCLPDEVHIGLAGRKPPYRSTM